MLLFCYMMIDSPLHADAKTAYAARPSLWMCLR